MLRPFLLRREKSAFSAEMLHPDEVLPHSYVVADIADVLVTADEVCGGKSSRNVCCWRLDSPELFM